MTLNKAYLSQIKTLYKKVTTRSNLNTIVLFFLTAIFVLGYLESLRWPLPVPRATHGVLKGLAILLAIFLVYFRKKLYPLKNVRFNILMLLMLVIYSLSTLFSQAVSSSILNLWYPFIATVVVFAFSKIKLTKRYLYIFVSLSVLLVFFTFTFSFFSLMFRYSVDNIYYFMFLDHRANHLLQEIRFYGKYVSLGPYIMLAPLTAIFLLEKKSTHVRRLLSFFALLVSLLTAVISNNRIDVLVFGIQSTVLLFLISKKQAVLFLLPTIFIAWFGLFVTNKYFGFNLEQRILRPKIERDLETIDIRYSYWNIAFYNFKNNPILGTGPNTYNDVSVFPLRRYYDRGVNQYTVRQDEGIGVHNIFIERLSDTGILGFFSFISLLLLFFKHDAKKLLSIGFKDKERFGTYMLFSLSSWSWILYGLTDNGYGAQGFTTFFFLRGLITHI